MKSINSKALSWIAIILSVIAMIITWLRVEVTIENDTFVGLMAGFMGACATILVGAQIYNSIDTKNSINKINESFNNKINELNADYKLRITNIDEVQKDLLKKLQDVNTESERLFTQTKGSIFLTTGLTFHDKYPLRAYKNYILGIDCYLKSEDIDNTNVCLHNIKDLIQNINSELVSKELFETEQIPQMIEYIKQNPKYATIKILFEELYKEIQNKL